MITNMVLPDDHTLLQESNLTTQATYIDLNLSYIEFNKRSRLEIRSSCEHCEVAGIDHMASSCASRRCVTHYSSFLPESGLGALLSSYLEGALYKFYR